MTVYGIVENDLAVAHWGVSFVKFPLGLRSQGWHFQSFSRTPGPPPFWGMNSIPAASKALRMAVIVLARGAVAPSSKRTRVLFGTPLTVTNSSRLQLSNPLAALTCAAEMVSTISFPLASDVRE